MAGASRGIGQRSARDRFGQRHRRLLRLRRWSMSSLRPDAAASTAPARSSSPRSTSATERLDCRGRRSEPDGVDILVCIAGGVRAKDPGRSRRCTADDFDLSSNSISGAAFLFIRAAAPGDEDGGQGTHRHDLKSRAALPPAHRHSGYCRLQARGNGLVAQLAHELGPFGIRVNTRCARIHGDQPRYEWDSNNWNSGFSGNFVDGLRCSASARREEIAKAVMFLASDRASWITGQTIPVPADRGNPQSEGPS